MIIICDSSSLMAWAIVELSYIYVPVKYNEAQNINNNLKQK
jgi:hypothetical protein